MYTREANGKELELRVSGMLYKDALVMMDRQTGTLWTQVDGTALRGPLRGLRLTELPAAQTTWKTWKTLHPDTVVLRKPADIRSSPYTKYFSDRERRGMFGTRGDERLDGKALVVGVRDGKDSVAVPVEGLGKSRLVQITVAQQPLVVYYSPQQKTAAVFRGTIQGKKLKFRLRTEGADVFLEDEGTKSRWSPLEGVALSGPLAGSRLEAFPYLLSFWYAWSAYQPNTRITAP